MKETVRAYRRKSLAKTRDTFLSTKQTAEQQTLVGKLAESNLPTLQKQASHPSLRSVEKSKKHHIPFTALALVLTLSSLCSFALLGHPLSETYPKMDKPYSVFSSCFDESSFT